jgi:hypothetical protein
MRAKKALTPQQKMKQYRQKLRAAGLRPVQLWLPETSTAAFAKKLRQESLLANKGSDEKAVMDFIEKTVALDGWV